MCCTWDSLPHRILNFDLNTRLKTFILVIHGCLVVLRRLLMVLRVLVGLGLLVRERVDPHVAVFTTPLGVSHGGGGEMGRGHHDGGLNALLPSLNGAAALLWKKEN